MKHREAASIVMNCINETGAAFDKLMDDLIHLKDQGQLSDKELDLVTETALSIFDKLQTKLVDVIAKEHPDLAPVCSACCECKPYEPDATDDEV